MQGLRRLHPRVHWGWTEGALICQCQRYRFTREVRGQSVVWRARVQQG